MDKDFDFVGSTVTTKRIRWDIRAKAMALSLVKQGEKEGVAIASTANHFEYEISGKKSYQDSPGVHIDRWEREFKAGLRDPDHKHHEVMREACEEFDLPIRPIKETVE